MAHFPAIDAVHANKSEFAMVAALKPTWNCYNQSSALPRERIEDHGYVMDVGLPDVCSLRANNRPDFI